MWFQKQTFLQFILVLRLIRAKPNLLQSCLMDKDENKNHNEGRLYKSDAYSESSAENNFSNTGRRSKPSIFANKTIINLTEEKIFEKEKVKFRGVPKNENPDLKIH
jgi:hypothetical protein